MANRITGLATGMDIDSIVSQTMQAYRSKIDVQQQKKDILEIKQKLYRDIIKESQDFYNKNLDILKSGSLLNTNTWQSVKFTSSNESIVSVTGSSEARNGNFKVTGDTAKAASLKVNSLGTKSEDESTIEVIVNGQAFEIKNGSYRDQATELNKKLSAAGLNVSVRYTAFTSDSTSAFIFESTVMGAGNDFTVGGSAVEGITSEGENAVAASYDLGDVRTLLNNAIGQNNSTGKLSFIVGDETEPISIDISKINDSTTELSKESIKNLTEAINKALSSKGYEVEISGADGAEKLTLKSKTAGSSDNDKKIKITSDNDKFTSIDVTLLGGKDATNGKLTLENSLTGAFSINGIYIDLSKKNIDETEIDYINKILTNNKSTVTLKLENDKWNLETKGTGEGAKIDVKRFESPIEVSIDGLIKDGKLEIKVGTEEYKIDGATNEEKVNNLNKQIYSKGYVARLDENNNLIIKKEALVSEGAKDADILIEDEKGNTYTHQGSGNVINVDGMTFTINGTIPTDGVNITSKKDATELTEKIKTFIEEYNTLVTKLNTLINEERDRDYQPLTKDQREALSENEVKLWDAKVEKGQLRKDSDLVKLNNSLKEAMRSLVSGTDINLKDIGIEAVADYGGLKNGTFTVNETKLKTALENDPESVMNLFVKSSGSTTSSASSYSSTGIMNRIKDILYNNTVSTKSNLIQKAGMEGTSTSATNTLTKAMQQYARKIEDMEVLFNSKEQALYTKFAALESMMNKYNSQLSYLTSSLG